MIPPVAASEQGKAQNENLWHKLQNCNRQSEINWRYVSSLEEDIREGDNPVD